MIDSRSALCRSRLWLVELTSLLELEALELLVDDDALVLEAELALEGGGGGGGGAEPDTKPDAEDAEPPF